MNEYMISYTLLVNKPITWIVFPTFFWSLHYFLMINIVLSE